MSQLSIAVHESIMTGGQGRYLDTLVDEFNAYRHSTRAVGGFWDMSFSIRNRLDKMEEWLEDGLGRHIVVYGAANEVVWEGFVDKVTITYGPLSVSRGPLSGVVNAVCMKAGNTKSRWNQNLASVERWGYFFKVLSFNDLTVAQAEKIRDMYLEKYREPEVKQDWGNTNHETNIVVDCTGYAQLLNCSIYDYPEATDTTMQLGAKIKQAVAMEANQIFTYQELLQNQSFETLGGGGVGDFANWTESGSVLQQITTTTYAHRPNTKWPNYCSAMLQNNAPANVSSNPKVTQDVATVVNKSYATVGWANSPRTGYETRSAYSILRTDTSATVISTVGAWTADLPWRLIGKPFVAPTTGSRWSMEVYDTWRYFNIYWDDVSIRDYPQMVENTYLVPAGESQDRNLLDVVKDLLSYGDTDNHRYLFGVYENRVPFYTEAPSTVEYVTRTTDNEHEFTSVEGERIPAWSVRPGKWCRFSDFLVGKSAVSDLKLDPRAMFIEEVRYSADEGLTLNSGSVSPLQQALYKLGITSLGS